MLVLLDLSTAFDTIDHGTRIRRLQEEYGISGIALQWFESYIVGRRQRVDVRNTLSDEAVLSCGVPQGSVLGPILFPLYTKNLGQHITHHNLAYHLYADDTQLIGSINVRQNQQPVISNVEQCTADVKSWMTINMLKLNEDKTEAILIGPKSRCGHVETTQLNICACGSHLPPK